jgi:hypothetical protein
MESGMVVKLKKKIIFKLKPSVEGTAGTRYFDHEQTKD